MGKQFILSRKESKKCTFLPFRMSRYADIIKTWTLNYATLYPLQCLNMLEFRLKSDYHIMATKPGLYWALALKKLKVFIQYNQLFISTLQTQSWNLRVKTWTLIHMQFGHRLPEFKNDLKYAWFQAKLADIHGGSKTWSFSMRATNIAKPLVQAGSLLIWSL